MKRKLMAALMAGVMATSVFTVAMATDALPTDTSNSQAEIVFTAPDEIPDPGIVPPPPGLFPDLPGSANLHFGSLDTTLDAIVAQLSDNAAVAVLTNADVNELRVSIGAFTIGGVQTMTGFALNLVDVEASLAEGALVGTAVAPSTVALTAGAAPALVLTADSGTNPFGAAAVEFVGSLNVPAGQAVNVGTAQATMIWTFGPAL